MEIRRLLTAAARNLSDARVEAISDEARFDCAFRALVQCATVAMHACGYRPSTSRSGHLVTLIQSLPMTLLDRDVDWILIDSLRRKRNVTDYSGDLVTPDMTDQCIQQAGKLRQTVLDWLQAQHPGLAPGRDSGP